MRIAAIADVHGNLLALEAVLADLATRDVDVVVNLGDLLSGAVQPRETADRLVELDIRTVAGNHERQLLTFPRERMSASDRLAHDAITDRHRAWMAGLPLTLSPAEGVLAFHGSPTDDLVYLLETVDPDGARPATTAEVLERLGPAADVPLLLCGHTHLQRAMALPTGALVLNPGSVGWPAYDDDHPHPHVMEAGTPHARYAIADDAGGSWNHEFRAVAYDWESAARTAEGNGRPDVAHALRTGRAGDPTGPSRPPR
ncbi:metallophosphoesterase family protein [Blastococcus sp. SYSU DS1024]